MKYFYSLLLVAILSVSAHAANVSYFNEPLETATSKLLDESWKVGFTDNSYRTLPVAYSTERQIPTKWATILQDAGERHGIAFLVDMEVHKILVTPIDGFKTPGVHYIQSRIAQHEKRYNWDYWSAKSVEEEAKNTLLLAAADERLKRQEIARIEAKYSDQLNVELEQVKKQQVAAAFTRAKLESERSSLNAKQSQLDNQIKQNAEITKRKQIELNNEIAATKEKQKSLESIKAEQKNVLMQQQELLAKEKEAKRIITDYYPAVDRVLPAGNTKSEFETFLTKYWDYKLAWSDDLLSLSQAKNISLKYPIYFKGSDLQRDVSTVVCSLTRDIPGITIFSEIDTDSRLVVMQMHKGSFALRKEILSQCFK